MQPFLAQQFRALGGREFLLFQFGFEGRVLRIGFGQQLLADFGEEADEKTARTAGGIADDVAKLRLGHLDHEPDDFARREELADLAAKGAAEEFLKRDTLHVLAGVGKVVAFQQPDDFTDGRELEADFLVVGEQVIGFVFLLGLREQDIDRLLELVGLLVEVISGETVAAVAPAQQAAFETHLHEKHLVDFIERGGGIKMFAIANDVVALVQQVGELVFLENF